MRQATAVLRGAGARSTSTKGCIKLYKAGADFSIHFGAGLENGISFDCGTAYLRYPDFRASFCLAEIFEIGKVTPTNKSPGPGISTRNELGPWAALQPAVMMYRSRSRR
jgi:hypothetical protein